jgi:hypothetical protein
MFSEALLHMAADDNRAVIRHYLSDKNDYRRNNITLIEIMCHLFCPPVN